MPTMRKQKSNSAKPPLNKGGRPRKQVSEESILELARIGCTQEETARILQCSVDTLTRRYADVTKRGKADLCGSLRKAQVKVAILRENPTMQIWLGKQLLGQKNDPPPAVSDSIAALNRQMEIMNEHNLALYGPDEGDIGDGDDGDGSS